MPKTSKDEPEPKSGDPVIPLQSVFTRNSPHPQYPGTQHHATNGQRIWLDLRVRAVFIQKPDREPIFFDVAQAKSMRRQKPKQ